MLQSVFSAFHKLIPPPFCEFGHEPFVRSGDFVRAVRVIPNRLAHTGETLRANLMDPSKHLPQKEFGASTRTSFFFQPGTSTMIQSSLSQQDLLFFVTLCRLQSLTVSAQKLNLSLSSACRMLTHLRETFGEPLFVRSRSGLMPTPGAMALLPKAIMLLDGFDDLFEPPVFDPAQAQRLIRIACADFGAVSILTKVIPAIIDKAPHLDFQILPIESDLVGKLSTGEIDFGIFPTEKTSPRIRSVRILESPYRYVVRRGHPLEAIYHAERKLTEEDLARWPNISVHVPPGSGIDPPAHTDARRNLPGRTQVRSAYILPQPALIAATDLVGIMPEVLIRGAQDAGIAISALSPVFAPSLARTQRRRHVASLGDGTLRVRLS